MSTVSMKLLKGAKMDDVAKELGDGEELDLAKMKAAELDKLVKEKGLEIEGFSGMKVAEKREAVKKAIEQAAIPDADYEDVDDGEKKATGTDVEVIEPHKGEIIEGDLIAKTAHALETVDAETARDLVAKLIEDTEFSFFKLGGVLSVINANGWYEPYGSFKEYVEHEHGIKYRNARYFISIYETLVEANIPWEKVKTIGWTKLKELLPVLSTENVDKWVEIANKNSTLQLIELVKSEKDQGTAETAETDSEPKTVTTMTFKVHDDQKATVKAAIEKAQKEAGTDVATVALEFICIDYLNGAPKAGKAQAKHKPIGETMKELGLEKTLEEFEKIFPDVELEVSIPEGEDG
jgi:hypothetical protein